MQRLTRSFRARLVLGALLWILVGLGVSWVLLTAVFERRVIAEFQSELDHHAMELAAIVDVGPSGRPIIRQPLSDHRFSDTGSGNYWQVENRHGNLRSASLGDHRMALTLDLGVPNGALMTTQPGPTGPMLVLERTVPAGPDAIATRVAVAVQESEINDMMEEMRWSFGLTLGAIALGLIGALVAQVTYGLHPLRRIDRALTAIRRGEATRLPDDLPIEVAPLAHGMNAVLSANEDVVRRGRVQAGNLAHALKTSLAVIMDEAERPGMSGAVLYHECERMRRQIDYHLVRARAAASSNKAVTAAPVEPAIRAIVAALSRLYRDRGLRFDIAMPDQPVVVACEAEDLDELLGNLIDNAGKWARARVRISAQVEPAGSVLITVEDDGPGMPEEARDVVFQAGQRFDEQKPGAGLGLAIVRDVAAMYGGAAWLERATLGGVAARLRLPKVRDVG